MSKLVPRLYPLVPKFGFTLVELLVVISVISIISTIGYVNLKGTQDRGRDARRKQDLKAVASALISYYQDNDAYPPPLSNPTTEFTSTSPDWIPGLTPSYIQNLPTDVKAGNTYYYKVVGTPRKDFELWAKLDNPNDKEATGQPNATCNLTPPAGGYNYCLESQE